MRSRLALLTTIVLVVAACGGDDEGLDVEGAWARTSPRMADAGAVYMEITSGEGDRLLAAAVDASIAGTVQIHETVMDDSMGEEGMGAMTMQQVPAIDLPPGETISLEPGGLHIMLLDLAAPLETGDTFEVTLTFENGGEKSYEVEVREEAP
jgi:copper(I)-binding protein